MAKLGRYASGRKTVEVLTEDKALTAGDCGTYFGVSGVADLTCSLPPASSLPNGWTCRLYQMSVTPIAVTSSAEGTWSTGKGAFVGNIVNLSADAAAPRQHGINPVAMLPSTKIEFSAFPPAGGSGMLGDYIEITLAKGIYSNTGYPLRHLFVVNGVCSGSAGIVFSGSAT